MRSWLAFRVSKGGTAQLALVRNVRGLMRVRRFCSVDCSRCNRKQTASLSDSGTTATSKTFTSIQMSAAMSMCWSTGFICNNLWNSFVASSEGKGVACLWPARPRIFCTRTVDASVSCELGFQEIHFSSGRMGVYKSVQSSGFSFSSPSSGSQSTPSFLPHVFAQSSSSSSTGASASSWAAGVAESPGVGLSVLMDTDGPSPEAEGRRSQPSLVFIEFHHSSSNLPTFATSAPFEPSTSWLMPTKLREGPPCGTDSATFAATVSSSE
mmetsp:Transcript_26047/g.68429  ORF Transcript_26047/g.68429 Transcript_26047/m.68429 type:complete len:267 (-) Transcript_26047:1542-2342(-)